MKNLIMTLCFLGFFLLKGEAQVFESFELDCPNTAHAFLNGCFTVQNGSDADWINTHGTADNRSIDPNTIAYDGDKWAHMYITKNNNCLNPDRGEGIALEFDFEAGVSYEFSFAIKGATSLAEWILTNGLPNSGGFGNCDLGEVVPAIPAGSETIWTFPFLQSPSWYYVNLCITPSSNYSQLWLRMSNMDYPEGTLYTHVFLDAVTVKEGCLGEIDCTSDADLSACYDQGDFGYISIECEGSFSWTFPPSNTATEYTTSNQSILLNASPGLYTVTVTASNGSTFTEDFLIEEACCENVPCEPVPPDFLFCQMSQGVTYLAWNEVPGALQYQINIFVNSPDCGCDGPLEAYSYLVQDNAFPLPGNLLTACFSWQVRTVCEGKNVSDFSALACSDVLWNCDEPD